jgi:hypothetical protein
LRNRVCILEAPVNVNRPRRGINNGGNNNAQNQPNLGKSDTRSLVTVAFGWLPARSCLIDGEAASAIRREVQEDCKD